MLYLSLFSVMCHRYTIDTHLDCEILYDLLKVLQAAVRFRIVSVKAN